MRYSALVVGMAALLLSCGGDAGGPTAPSLPEAVAPAAQAGASDSDAVVASLRPTKVSFTGEVPGLNPCTGTMGTSTFDMTCLLHFDTGAAVLTCKRTITHDDFVGHGNVTQVVNGHVVNFVINNILKNDSGDRIRVHVHTLLDLSTETMRIDQFNATCLGQ